MTKEQPVLFLPTWFLKFASVCGALLTITALPWSVWVTVTLLRLPGEYPPAGYREVVTSKLDANAERLRDVLNRLERIESRQLK